MSKPESAAFEAEIVDIRGMRTQIITLAVTDGYRFRAGQYLEIIAGDDTRIPLSIASAPGRLPELELHYRSTPGIPAAAAMDVLLEGSHLYLSPAHGDVRAGAPQQDVLIVAGGTGAAQAFSCAEYRAATGATGATTIVWCADAPDDLYETSRLAGYANVRLHEVIDDRRTPANEGLMWLRQHGSRFAAHGAPDDGAYVLLAGAPAFVYATLDVLLEQGVHQAQCHADAFSYAPRH